MAFAELLQSRLRWRPARRPAGEADLCVALNSGETTNPQRPMEHLLGTSRANSLPRLFQKLQTGLGKTLQGSSCKALWLSAWSHSDAFEDCDWRMAIEALGNVFFWSQQGPADGLRSGRISTLVTDCLVLGSNFISGGRAQSNPLWLAANMQTGWNGEQTCRALLLAENGCYDTPVNYLCDRLQSYYEWPRDQVLAMSAKKAYSKLMSANGKIRRIFTTDIE
jgi:hypothetical protein